MLFHGAYNDCVPLQFELTVTKVDSYLSVKYSVRAVRKYNGRMVFKPSHMSFSKIVKI